mmetsp:Transcript_136918/g.425401  ORF Transcript_136918/g.425401 Transcript_136918/m.425401 type:complete len:333 (-) Transcript_136918:125-1123(-)
MGGPPGGGQSEFLVLLQAGTIGSAAACVLSTPLDVARHSAQAALAARRSTPGFREALRAAAKPAFVSGLWRGLPWALGRASLSPAVFLLAYEQQKAGREALEAGLVARGVQATLLQPLEFLRVSRQAGACLAAPGRAHLERGLWSVVVEDGVWTLWRALGPTLARDLAFSGVLWASYGGLRRAVLGSGPEDGFEDEEPSSAHAVRLAGLASASSAFAAVVTQPLDVVKTKMQVHQLVRSNKEGYKKVQVARFFRTLREVHAAAGLRGLWAGGLARSLSAAACGLFLGPLFEYCQLLAEDTSRPVRKQFILPEDPAMTIVHPRSTRSTYIDVK